MSVIYSVPHTHSTIGRWATLIAKTMDSYGLDSRAIFSHEGVSLDKLRENNARIDNVKLANICLQAQQLCNDPYFSLRLANCMKPCVLDALGLSLSMSQHVYDALKRFTRFSSYLNDAMDAILHENKDEVALSICSKSPPLEATNLHIEATFSSVFKMLKSISGENFKVKALHFRHAFNFDHKPFEDFYNCPVFFSSDKNEIIFERSGIFDNYCFSNSILTRKLDEWLDDYLLNHSNSLASNKVKIYLLKQPHLESIDQQEVAEHLDLSIRMLQRKLKEENTSYTKLLDECRQKIAFKLILDETMSLTKLTSILGFAEQTNFTRAFKRWSGTTPHQYRSNTVH
ncbi:MAG: AraC family transcriptional regulator ligand-binding domain-containing protein [Bermanella sp.]